MPLFMHSAGSSGSFQGGYEGRLKSGMLFNSGNLGRDIATEMIAYNTFETIAQGRMGGLTGGAANIVSGGRARPFIDPLLAKGAKIPGVAPASGLMSSFFRAQMANIGGYMPFMAADMLGQYGLESRHERKQRRFRGNLEMYSTGFHDTKGASTMRQTAMTMVQHSQMGIRSALSREAFHMHR